MHSHPGGMAGGIPMQVHQTTLGGLKRLKANYEEVFLLGRWNHVGPEYATPCRHPHHLRQRR